MGCPSMLTEAEKEQAAARIRPVGEDYKTFVVTERLDSDENRLLQKLKYTNSEL